jgi:Fe-S cluster assembly scaffold protein SufB
VPRRRKPNPTPAAAAALLLRRLKAYRKWLTMEEPDWSDNRYPRIDYQDLSYYSAPKVSEKKQSLDEVGGWAGGRAGGWVGG